MANTPKADCLNIQRADYIGWVEHNANALQPKPFHRKGRKGRKGSAEKANNFKMMYSLRQQLRGWREIPIQVHIRVHPRKSAVSGFWLRSRCGSVSCFSFASLAYFAVK